jgi:hypothetical protein
LHRDINTHTTTPRLTTTAEMGKKRKAGGRAYGEAKAPKEDDSKLAINTWEDVADSEDEFHINRDKVLLDEGPAAKKLRKWQEEGKNHHTCTLYDYAHTDLMFCRQIPTAFG